MNTQAENLFTPDCIRTHSGIYMNVFEPTPEMISIKDIAHALAHQCRFAGHMPSFYSVAQHSWYCAQLVDKEHQLAALLHDASEAYLVDMPRPIKNRLPDYKRIEDSLMKAIAAHFGFQYPLHEEVKKVDDVMLRAEWDNLILGNPVFNSKTNQAFSLSPLSPSLAKAQFLKLYNELKPINHA